MEQDKISVIVPVYRCEKYIRKCIESILEQEYNNFELLLVLDGISDTSNVICYEYQQKDPRVSVIEKENEGVSSARNKGIDEATGDWIAFVDSDDWLDPNYLSTLLSVASNNKVDIAICSYFVEYENKSIPESFFKFNKHLFDKSEIDELLINCWVPYGFGNDKISTNVGVPWGKLYKTKFIKENQIRYVFGLNRMQDMVFNLYAFIAADGIVYKNISLYHYLKSSGASTVAYRSDFYSTIETINKEVYKFINDNEKKSIERFFYSKNVLLLIEMIKLQYIPREARMSFQQKINDIKIKINSKIFSNALEGYDSALLSRNQNILAFLMKHRCIILAYLLIYHKHKIQIKLFKRA